MTATETAPAPGVYRGVPEADYHSWDAASNSRLGNMAPPKTPAHCKAAIDEQFKDTEALAFGRAAHTAILEPDEFLGRYQLATQCQAETKQKKRCSKMGSVPLAAGGSLCGIHAKEWDDDRSHREILSPTDWERAAHMRDSVHSIPVAHNLLGALSSIELSILWHDEPTGVLCKGRLDGISEALPNGCVVDLKTTRDASPREFEKAIANYGYHRQGAMYLEAAAAHGIPARHYVIIAVEHFPPYAVGLYRLSEGTIEAGADELRRLLPQYAECLESGIWPGFPPEIVDIGLPDWHWKRIGES